MSTHEDFDRSGEAKTSSDRSFGIVFAVVFAVVWLWPLVFDGRPRWWALVLAAAFLIVALAAPRLLAPANRLWTKFGTLLHHVVSPVVLGFLFYLVVTPTGMIMRGFGKDPLRLRPKPKAESYWIDRRPPGPPPESMPHQF